MPTRRALRLLRPLLAPSRTAQPWTASARFESSCASTPEPPCPPCSPAPRPPCRARPVAALPAQRVVCCPPPRGMRPPCAATEPDCPLTCENHMTQEKSVSVGASEVCGAEHDRVAHRMRQQDELRRAMYEREVAELRAAPPPLPPVATYRLPAPAQRARATDGRTYTVLSATPPPRCDPNAVGGPQPCASPIASAGPTSPCPQPTSSDPPPLFRAPSTTRTHPPPQPVNLAPAGNCTLHGGVDVCAHRPRVLLSIDRSAVPKEPVAATSSSQACQNSGLKSPAPSPLPKACTSKQTGCAKGLTSRIMESLGRGRSVKSSGREAKVGGREAKVGGPRAGSKGWCASMPKVAAAPPKCRERTLTERLQSGPPGPCGGSRRLHTSSAHLGCEKRPAASTSGSESAVAASQKLKAVLQERDQLQEAGRGREVRPVRDTPLAPPRGAGGALELRVPPGADTVSVRVSLGVAAPPPAAASAPTTQCGTAPSVGSSSSDSWLSIKNLHKKLSGCGRIEPSKGAVGSAPPAPTSCKTRPETAATPSPTSGKPCAPRGPVKMGHLVANTIFIKS